MPHNSATPVRSMWPAASSTMASRLAHVSLNEAPAGARSRSWNVKNGTPRRWNVSKAAAIFCLAWAMGSPPGASHGRSRVPSPKMSWPGHVKECQ